MRKLAALGVLLAAGWVGCGSSQPSVEAGCGEQADYEEQGAACARYARCGGGSKPSIITMRCEGSSCVCGWRIWGLPSFGVDGDHGVNGTSKCRGDSCDLDEGCCADWFFGGDGVATR